MGKNRNLLMSVISTFRDIIKCIWIEVASNRNFHQSIIFQEKILNFVDIFILFFLIFRSLILVLYQFLHVVHNFKFYYSCFCKNTQNSHDFLFLFSCQYGLRSTTIEGNKKTVKRQIYYFCSKSMLTNWSGRVGTQEIFPTDNYTPLVHCKCK